MKDRLKKQHVDEKLRQGYPVIKFPKPWRGIKLVRMGNKLAWKISRKIQGQRFDYLVGQYQGTPEEFEAIDLLYDQICFMLEKRVPVNLVYTSVDKALGREPAATMVTGHPDAGSCSTGAT